MCRGLLVGCDEGVGAESDIHTQTLSPALPLRSNLNEKHSCLAVLQRIIFFRRNFQFSSQFFSSPCLARDNSYFFIPHFFSFALLVEGLFFVCIVAICVH